MFISVKEKRTMKVVNDFIVEPLSWLKTLHGRSFDGIGFVGGEYFVVGSRFVDSATDEGLFFGRKGT